MFPKPNPGFVAGLVLTSWFVLQITCPSAFAGNYVVAWNATGQVSVPFTATNVLAIAIGYTHHVAIVGDSLPRPVEPMLNAAFNHGQFIIAQPTALGRSYRLGYQNSLTDDWQLFPPVPGYGSTQNLIDPNPPPSQRFYCVYAGQ